MPLITKLLRRRRRQADLTWRLATRAEDVERIRHEAGLNQDQAHAEAVRRLFALAEARRGRAA